MSNEVRAAGTSRRHVAYTRQLRHQEALIRKEIMRLTRRRNPHTSEPAEPEGASASVESELAPAHPGPILGAPLRS